MNMFELENIHTNKLYYMEKSEVNESVVPLYSLNGSRLTQSKFVGNQTLKGDYKITGEICVEREW